MSKLSSFNCSVTELDKGVTLLEASAGTGKTYALARIFLRLVAEKGVEVGKILTVTFTSTATEELRDRIRSLLVEAHETLIEEKKEKEDPTFSRLRDLPEVTRQECIQRIKLAITCFDEANISTIHGFCNRVLTENSFETQSLFDAKLEEASKAMTLEGVREYWREKFATLDPLIAAASSSKKINPEEMADFFNALPRTQKYELGFDEKVDAHDVALSLIAAFDCLKDSWNKGREDYADYVTTCLAKNARAKTHLQNHLSILNDTLLNDQPSPSGIEVLDQVRALNLKPKKDFIDRNKPTFSKDADQFCSVLDIFGSAVRVDCIKYLEKRIDDWKASRGLLFFDDLLSLTAKAITSQDRYGRALREGLSESIDAALIDEFQDTDPVQFEIFKELFGKSEKHWLYLIGDPKQSIYRFRGADLEAYFAFAKSTRAKKYSLDTNYRTVTPLVRSINAFFDNSVDPFLHPELAFVPVNPDFGGEADEKKTYREDGEIKPAFLIREMDWVKEKKPAVPLIRRAIQKDMTNEIHHLLNKGTIGGKKVQAKDIAVLVRSNPQALKLWQYFRNRGLSTVVFSDISLFNTPEAREILWVMEGLVNVRSESSIKRALATGLLGMTSQDFQHWQDQPEKWDDWIGLFREHQEIWRKKGIYVALRELFRTTRAIPKNLKRPDGERRVTNFLHLTEVLHQASSSSPISPSSLVVWLRTKMAQNETATDEYQLRLESQSASIRILTVHKSKGLEYPIVFLPEHFFPPSQNGKEITYHGKDGKLTVDLKKTAHEDAKSLWKREEEQEDARVLYVALTRSASRCYVYHAPDDFSEKSQIPAQVNVMRSWGSKSCTEESTGTGSCNDLPGENGERLMNGLKESFDYRKFSSNPMEIEGNQTSMASDDFSEMKARTWDKSRKLPRGKIVDSFSGLSRQVGFNGHDFDGIAEGKDMQEDFLGIEKTPIFNFPAGANAGSFMHEVFEHLEFSDSSNWKSLIREKLKDYYYDPQRWTAPILSMIEQVMSTDLEPGFCLKKLARSDRLEEMEFHFPMVPGFLPELAGSLPKSSVLRKYLSRLKGDDFLRIEENGYLNGLVDLIFRTNEKYYIVDWKSNILGGFPEGFGHSEIEKEMFSHHYVLQYHLYVLATHLFLSGRMEDYSYERNFGGVYYLFVRGMKVGTGQGIYFDLPDFETIQAMENFLVPKT
ncbi:MAG: exodeoxyribonuclease V subunit beta [Verrucomicrobia bacterium TMED56]|nr:MAG: exodeoxyribonuclease V subunit beta [Verrucomicrobia bacterium TMED56]